MKNFMYKIVVTDYTLQILTNDSFVIANDIYSNKKFCLDQFEKWIKHIPQNYGLKDYEVKDEYYDKVNRVVTWYCEGQKRFTLQMTLERINRRMFY